MALEPLAEEDRVERHLVRGDADDAERVEERLPPFAVEPHELVVGDDRATVIPRPARVAVDVGHDRADVLLLELVEARAVLEDPADEAVVVLHVSLLPGAEGVAVEEPRPARDDLRRVVDWVRAVVLDHVGVRELRPVVREHDREELAVERVARRGVQQVEDARARLRGPRLPQEREHEPAVRELEGEEDLASVSPDDGVHLDDGRPWVRLPVGEELLVGPADAALRVGLRLGLPTPRPPAPGLGEVGAPDVEESGLDIPVDRALGDAAEDARIARYDVADGLSAEDAGREDAVHPRDERLVGVDPASRLAEGPGVVRLGALRDVEPLLQRAVVEPVAPVADVRGRPEPRADGLAELGADRVALRRAAELPVALGTAALARAGLEVRADAVRASVAPVARDPPVEDLADDRRIGATTVLRDLRDGPPQPEQEFDPAPVGFVHVFRHDGIPFFRTRPSGVRHRARREDASGKSTERRCV